jgi:hypothetical protein
MQRNLPIYLPTEEGLRQVKRSFVEITMLMFATSVSMAIDSSCAFGITKSSKSSLQDSKYKQRVSSKKINYTQDVNLLKTDLPLAISAQVKTLAIPDENLFVRINKSKSDPRIEPVQLAVPSDDDKILALAGRVAKVGKKLELAHVLRSLQSSGESVAGSDVKLVSIDPSIMELLSRDELDLMFAKDHSYLRIDTKSLRRDSLLASKFIRQVAPFLSKEKLTKLKSKIIAGKPIRVDQDALPDFAESMITRHTVFKGPNCFHAALSFQGPLLASSKAINVREEAGYHTDMINYDELWRVVQLKFYEVDPRKVSLQYGDMILFFDRPKVATDWVDFRSIRHASTYLFGGYAFAKGSKSPNSPYVIRPLVDEWSTWTKYTENLGVKVFRRSLNRDSKAPVWDPKDWMY